MRSRRTALLSSPPAKSKTSVELRHLDPQLSYFYEQGLLLVSRLDEPGAASNLAYFGRELSRGVLQRILDDEEISIEDLNDMPEGDRSSESEFIQWNLSSAWFVPSRCRHAS